MPDVYRKGTKSVHRSLLIGGSRFDVTACNLDPGGQWGSDIPAGHQCPTCFVGDGPAKAGVAPAQGTPRRANRGKVAAAAGGTALLALAAAVWASQPVSTPVPSFIAISSGGSALSSAIVTPGPSDGPPVPTEVPAFTPLPTYPPLPTFGPIPTYPPLPTPIVIYVLPQPTPPPTKAPFIPVACTHPGHHSGVDACRWPHN